MEPVKRDLTLAKSTLGQAKEGSKAAKSRWVLIINSGDP